MTDYLHTKPLIWIGPNQHHTNNKNTRNQARKLYRLLRTNNTPPQKAKQLTANYLQDTQQTQIYLTEYRTKKPHE